MLILWLSTAHFSVEEWVSTSVHPIIGDRIAGGGAKSANRFPARSGHIGTKTWRSIWKSWDEWGKGWSGGAGQSYARRSLFYLPCCSMETKLFTSIGWREAVVSWPPLPWCVTSIYFLKSISLRFLPCNAMPGVSAVLDGWMWRYNYNGIIGSDRDQMGFWGCHIDSRVTSMAPTFRIQ